MARVDFSYKQLRRSLCYKEISPRDGMVDITDLKSVAVRRAGSSPAAGTNQRDNYALKYTPDSVLVEK